MEEKLEVATQEIEQTRATLGQAQERIKETQEQVHATQLVVAHGRGGRPAAPVPELEPAAAGMEAGATAPTDGPRSSSGRGLETMLPGAEEFNPDDPQRGRWGGKWRRNGRILSATVTPVPRTQGWYNVRLEVRSTDSENNPLKGHVRFHLHPTFTPQDPVVPVTGGVAALERIAWGAFTVGAEADDGETPLELNLAELEDAPAEFRLR